MSKTTRGIRNHNPGNIRKSGDKWQGLADPPHDGAFFRFLSPVWGIRAMAVLLIAYQDRHGLATVAEIIGRWAPPNENDTGNYARFVAASMGVAVDSPIDVHLYAILRPMIEAMIAMENGQQPYAAETLDEGLRRAGVVAPPKPLSQSKELQAAGGVGAVGVATVVADAVTGAGEAREQLASGTWVGLVAGLLLLGLAAWLAWNRIKARKDGRR